MPKGSGNRRDEEERKDGSWLTKSTVDREKRARTTTGSAPYGVSGVNPEANDWVRQPTLDDPRSRYGRSRYKRHWHPTPEQIQLAQNLGLDGGYMSRRSGIPGSWSQDDRYRLDVALTNAGYGNSDNVTAANFEDRMLAIDSMKQYAADNGIPWSVDEDKLTDLLNHRGEKVGGANHVGDNYHTWIGMDAEEAQRRTWEDGLQSKFGYKFWKGEQDLPNRGLDAHSAHPDDPANRRQGRDWIAGEDPAQTQITLSDLNSYLAGEYAAPGREGKWKPGQDDPRRTNENKLDQTSWGTTGGQEAVEELRTKFIDEVYGTTDGWYDTDNPPAMNEAVDNSWGLDLVRDWSDEGLLEMFDPATFLPLQEGQDVSDVPLRDRLTEQQSYEYQTRGLINWEFYRDDSAFQAAFADQFEDGIGLDNSAGISSVAEIRALLPDVYQDQIIKGQGKDSWKTQWEGKYEPPPLKPPWEATEIDVDSLTTTMDKIQKDEPASGPTMEVMDATQFRQSLQITPIETQVPNLIFDSGRGALEGVTGPVAETGEVAETLVPKEE